MITETDKSAIARGDSVQEEYSIDEEEEERELLHTTSMIQKAKGRKASK